MTTTAKKTKPQARPRVSSRAPSTKKVKTTGDFPLDKGTSNTLLQLLAQVPEAQLAISFYLKGKGVELQAGFGVAISGAIKITVSKDERPQ